MGTNFSAATQTVDGSALLQVDEIFERDAPPGRVNPEIYNALPPFRQELILPSTYMRSRGAWAMEMLDNVCRLARIDGLKFLAGLRSPEFKIIAVRDDDEGFIRHHGFLLDEPAIQKANTAITRLFEWSAANLDVLAEENLMGYYAYKDGIIEAIQKPVVAGELSASSRIGMSIKGYEDGDGPWYFYSWLYSVQQVLKAGILFNLHVWHTTDLFE